MTSLARPIVFWVLVAAVLAVLLVLLHAILMPFVAGMVIAYLLDPLVNRLERLGINRLATSLAVVGAFLFGLAFLLFLTVPYLAGEVTELIESFPTYVARIEVLAIDTSRPWISKIMGEGFHIEQSFGQIANMGSAWVKDFLHSLWSGGQALISIVSLLIVTPIVACYLVYYWKGMLAAIDGWIPPPHRATVRMLAREIDETVSGYVRGQTLICLILAVIYASGLALLGLRHAVLIGLLAGAISFVPYLGAGTGMLLSVCVAIAQFWPHWTPVVIVLAIFLVGETIADYALAPHLVGHRVHLNPVWLMFALFAFGYLFGFVGLLIAVPVSGALGVLVRFALKQYRASALYTPAE